MNLKSVNAICNVAFSSGIIDGERMVVDAHVRKASGGSDSSNWYRSAISKSQSDLEAIIDAMSNQDGHWNKEEATEQARNAYLAGARHGAKQVNRGR